MTVIQIFLSQSSVLVPVHELLKRLLQPKSPQENDVPLEGHDRQAEASCISIPDCPPSTQKCNFLTRILETGVHVYLLCCYEALLNQPPPHYWFQLEKEIKNRTHRQLLRKKLSHYKKPHGQTPPLSLSLDIESLLWELAVVKIECAECADLLERKVLEMRKLNKKYSDTEKELKEAHETVGSPTSMRGGSYAKSIDGVASSVNSESSKQTVTIAIIKTLNYSSTRFRLVQKM
uniref:Uncharacterized protein n=1 Tax=Amphimedon queenslandica TaxID=400682 RepID=A0A1X7TG87_AMPQE